MVQLGFELAKNSDGDRQPTARIVPLHPSYTLDGILQEGILRWIRIPIFDVEETQGHDVQLNGSVFLGTSLIGTKVAKDSG